MLIDRNDKKRLERIAARENDEQEYNDKSKPDLQPEEFDETVINAAVTIHRRKRIYRYVEDEKSSGGLITYILAGLMMAVLVSNFKNVVNIIPSQDDNSGNGNEKTEKENENLSDGTLKKQELDFNKIKNMSSQEFIETFAPYAIEIGPKYSIYPSTFLAQLIWESGWGNKSGKNLTVPYNNLFGIKADESWKGEKVELPTERDAQETGWFRVYKTPYDSMEDHGKFLNENPRYERALKCFKEKKGGKAQVREIAKAGYGEDKDYEPKLIGTIEYHNLEKYDKMLETFLKKQTTLVKVPFEQKSETLVYDNRTKRYYTKEQEDEGISI